jgi:HK97 family phage major capsid protein
MTLEQLIQKRREAIEAARAILETATADGERSLTEEERTAWEGHLETAETLKGEIAVLERQAAAEAELAATTAPAPKPAPSAAPAVHTRDERPYSILRAIRASAARSWTGAEVERRASDELAELLGREPQETHGLLVPYRALLPVGAETRDIGKVAPTTYGAALVATDLMPQEFIELLRNQTLVVQAGARLLPNLVGDVDIPRQSAGAVAGWVATEGGDVGEDEVETEAVSLSPKTVGIRTDMTRRMVKQSSIGLEDLVREDIRGAIGIAVDAGAISGTGASGQPTGVINTSGVGTVTTSGTPTWPLIVEFETDVESANALQGRLAWMTRSAVKGELKTTVKESGQAVYLMGEDGVMNGYPSFITEQVPAQTLIFGNWAEILIGMWGGLDLFADPYTLGDSGGLVVRGFQDIDVAVRHGASFSKAADL